MLIPLFVWFPFVCLAQITADQLGGCGGTTPENEITADPSNYTGLVATLQPGDRLSLTAGTYENGLALHDIQGEPNNCIVISGPESGPPAVFMGRDCCNTISLENSSFLVIQNLTIDGDGKLGDAVKAESTGDFCHHITLENLTIINQDADQQIVGISTKCPAWNWVIRKNTIDGAGTGIYFGDSNGEAEFVNGLVEFNTITNTLGYNLQIKHQNGRAAGIPPNAQTIIRHNSFHKSNTSNGGPDARPNVLVGHWPLTGNGMDDVYLVYGNFFFENPTENLFQGEGNIAFYQNLCVSSSGGAVAIQPHQDVPKTIRVFQNTILSAGTGISVVGGDISYTQLVTGNAVFSNFPLNGGTQTDNLTDDLNQADAYLNNPFGDPLAMSLDLYPLNGLNGSPLDLTAMTSYEDWNKDFNGTSRPGTFRGGYAGEGNNPGWVLGVGMKCLIGSFSNSWEQWPTVSVIDLILSLQSQCHTPD